MAAFNYTQPVDATLEHDSYNHKVYGLDGPPGPGATTDAGTITTKVPLGLGPIPYITRYSPSGSASFLYIQTDRVLVTSGALTTAANYTLVGTSPPTVTTVTFTADKSYIRLTLSSLIDLTYAYSLKVKSYTFSDVVGVNFNIAGPIPIIIDCACTGVGIAETISVGTPVMS